MTERERENIFLYLRSSNPGDGKVLSDQLLSAVLLHRVGVGGLGGGIAQQVNLRPAQIFKDWVMHAFGIQSTSIMYCICILYVRISTEKYLSGNCAKQVCQQKSFLFFIKQFCSDSQ